MQIMTEPRPTYLTSAGRLLATPLYWTRLFRRIFNF